MKRIILLNFIILLLGSQSFAQAVPAPEENIPFLVTFGKDAKKSYGDDDNCQTFFFSIPKSFSKPVYIRIFDPETGGKYDEIYKSSDSETSFELYGGNGCVSNKDSRETDPTGDFKSGNLLHSKTFKNEENYDDKWYTIGPLNPSQGEYSEDYFGYVFKLICQGTKGDDGNLYKYFLSTSPSENIAISGGNAFTFEYSFRLNSNNNQVSHIYPFVDDYVTSIKQTNFDFDNDGVIELSSVTTKGHKLKMSGDNEIAEDKYVIIDREKGTSLDIQLIKGNKKISNNNVVFYVTNQYGEAMPFFAVPIGGTPKYVGKLTIKPAQK
jgi:hypothetical protein